jgi:hypothetical protein
MSTIPEPPPIPRPKPPVFVWIISIWLLFGVVGGIASVLIMHADILPMPPAQKQYFDSLTWVDYAMTVAVTVINGVGAVLFILLRRWAYYLFTAAFIIGVSSIGYQIATKHWLSAVGGAGLGGAIGGWMISLAIIFYARYLAKKRVLR